MKLLKLTLFFLIINFGGLYVGSWFMDGAVNGDWYTSLNKAPWTPPGWVFGMAWTLIMLCFSLFLAILFKKKNNLNLQILYGIQILLNVSWNYIFFNQQLIGLGLVVLVLLTLVIFYFFFQYKKILKNSSYLLLPYMIWLLIATSLNAYIFINN